MRSEVTRSEGTQSEVAGPAGAVTRRYDPDRRHNIARATMRLVAELGADNLTFRAVAREAEVPLGSLTYHYANKEELLLTALAMARAENAGFLRGLLERFDPEADFGAAFCRLVESITVEHREQLILDYEWIFATRRRPSLEEENRHWNEDLILMLAEHVDRTTAQWLAALLHGFLMEAVLLGSRFTAREIAPLVRRVLAPDPRPA